MGADDMGAGRDWDFLWGKRHWRRLATERMVSLRLRALEFPGCVVNLSAGGVLLRLPTQMIQSHLVASSDLPDVLALQRAFTRALHVRLSPDDVERRAVGVRIDWRAKEKESIYVGCQFEQALTEQEVEALGFDAQIRMGETGRTLPAVTDMSWQVRDDAGAALEVRREHQDTWFRGVLLAMHERNLAFRIDGEEPTGLIADLAHERLEVRVLDGDEALWAAPAWLVGVRVRDEGGVEIVVQAEDTPDPITLGLFEVRAE